MVTRPLVILGTGRIARALLAQVLARDAYLRERYGLTLPVAAIGNRRFTLAGAPYLAPERLAAIARHGLDDGEPAPDDAGGSAARLIELARTCEHKAIVADLTAADGLAPVLAAALDAGLDVVLANKKPLCADFDLFQRLTANPRGRLGYEATVGAGLPIVAALRALHDAGDALTDATACLSGTLGYICTRLEEGQMLSAIVPEARDRGYTEPDPREDLSGDDVRRKALILARTMGLRLDMDDIPRAPLVPLTDGPLDEWLAGLTRCDRVLAERVRSAREQGCVLRYVARLSPQGCEVGLQEVPRLSAVGRLFGTDNILTMHTRFYDERPLTISGPGAGPDVTAAGVFADLLRLAGVA